MLLASVFYRFLDMVVLHAPVHPSIVLSLYNVIYGKGKDAAAKLLLLRHFELHSIPSDQ